MPRFRDVTKRLRGRRPAEPVEFRVVDIAAADTAQHPDLLLRLADVEVDAVLLRGVLSPGEVDRALSGFEELHEQRSDEFMGHVLGMPLLRLGQGETDRTPYYDSTERARELYRTAFGFDPHERVASVLEPMAGGRKVVPPTEDGRAYNPGNLRWYLPGQGGLYPHVGNEFVEQNEAGALGHLLGINEVRGWTSWFMVLQRPDSGGTLTLYDLTHAGRPADFESYGEEERAALFLELRHATFDPGPGDLIAFTGGVRYHRVEDIGPGRPRITYGAFLHLDRDGARFHSWA
ncbi:hypothetical protein KSP35_18505 [Aquihabitans sp. G128]|uniref:2OG-Fe(II)-dependent halogenase WelO5 family protein n=1 Tax=Aquihabitans sp. G128 TaxID=2849779 RepID=UPI001C2510EC|nr:hypothetical protein [Aquihabitans sp. G128]QXC60305.1 hypothetical protein KSP35_18505 [Aquihabitans sp. G128]